MVNILKSKVIDKIQGNEREKFNSKNIRPNSERGNGLAHGDYGKVWEDSNGNSEWEGWGTALKPACEPIVVARKPLSEKNVALNVLKWGTGGINIDECRIEFKNKDDFTFGHHNKNLTEQDKSTGMFGSNNGFGLLNADINKGRFPANVILDEEAGEMLDEQSGNTKSSDNDSIRKPFGGLTTGLFDTKETNRIGYTDIGGASRFFYCAKASKGERNLGCDELEEKKYPKEHFSSERLNDLRMKGEQARRPNQNNHPTVKPITLMEYLIKLVTKENQIVLDPFAGSGTTAIACYHLNRQFILIEKEHDYIKIAEARLKPYLEQTKLNEVTTQ